VYNSGKKNSRERFAEYDKFGTPAGCLLIALMRLSEIGMQSINLKCKAFTTELISLAVYTFESTLSQSHLRFVIFVVVAYYKSIAFEHYA